MHYPSRCTIYGRIVILNLYTNVSEYIGVFLFFDWNVIGIQCLYHKCFILHPIQLSAETCWGMDLQRIKHELYMSDNDLYLFLLLLFVVLFCSVVLCSVAMFVLFCFFFLYIKEGTRIKWKYVKSWRLCVSLNYFL